MSIVSGVWANDWGVKELTVGMIRVVYEQSCWHLIGASCSSTSSVCSTKTKMDHLIKVSS